MTMNLMSWKPLLNQAASSPRNLDDVQLIRVRNRNSSQLETIVDTSRQSISFASSIFMSNSDFSDS